MDSSLRDIPGAGRDRRSARRRPAPLPAGPYRPQLLIDPSARRGATSRRRPLFQPRRRPDLFLVVLTVACVAVAAYLVQAAWSANQVDAGIEGIDDGALLTAGEAAALEITVRFGSEEQFDASDVTLDGRSLDGVEEVDGGVRWRPAPDQPLAEGTHVLELSTPRALSGVAVSRVAFTVDGTPPELRVPAVLPPAAIDRPVVVEGQVDPDATLLVEGRDVDVDPDAGTFRVPYDLPPAGPVQLVATDPAGNETATSVIVPVAYPGARAVHVSAAVWGHDELRQGVLDLIDAGKIDAVELSLKDEGGTIGHTSDVPLAREIGASLDMFDLEEAVATLHDRGVRVIGRLVAFRDPVLAEAAWDRGDRDWVIQTAAGEPLPNYGGFTNFAHPDVRRYNLDVALEAVEAGVDEILWDYIRRPEGDLAQMLIPGLDVEPTQSVTDFMAETHPELRARGVFQGVSVFGIAASRPDAVGQDVPALARHADVIAPMVYPSLWVAGEYRVPDPVRMPYEIVKASVADFQEAVAGTGAKVVPWLQHFSLGPTYGPTEVRAQIQATADLGIDDWLLWSPSVRYDPAGLDPIPGRPSR